MTIDNLKQLQKLIALCQKTGVLSIKVDGIELQLSSMPTKQPKRQAYVPAAPEADIKVPKFNGYDLGAQAPDLIDTEELSDEQLMFYSARPEVPGEQ